MNYGTAKRMIKLSAAPNASQKRDDTKTLGGLLATGTGAAIAAGSAKGMTGRETLYHGGKAGIADLVKKQGLRSREDLGDSLSNASVTETVTSPKVNSSSKNLVFTTNRKSTAKVYANQVKAMDDSVAKGERAIDGLNQFRSNPVSMLTGYFSAPEGSVAEMNVPLWKLRERGDLVRNPEIDDLVKKDMAMRLHAAMAGLKGAEIDEFVKDYYEDLLGERGGTYTIRGGVGTEYVPGASNYKRISLAEMSEFARKNKGQFGKATLKTIGGLGVGAAGLKMLSNSMHNKTPVRGTPQKVS